MPIAVHSVLGNGNQAALACACQIIIDLHELHCSLQGLDSLLLITIQDESQAQQLPCPAPWPDWISNAGKEANGLAEPGSYCTPSKPAHRADLMGTLQHLI